MKITHLTHSILLALAIITPVSATANTDKAANEVQTVSSDNSQAVTAQTERFASQQEMRANIEKMQEQAFQQYIESLKNHPAASQLPPEVQQRRAEMIQKMQDQHAIMVKMRKQHQQDAEKRRNQRMQELKKI